MSGWWRGAWVALLVARMAAADAAEPLRVLGPASLSTVLPEVIADWRARGGGEVVLSLDATSRVAAWVRAGAPADVVLTADAAWMDVLVREGLVRPETRVDLAGNRLVVIVPAGAAWRPADAAALATLPPPGRLAVAGEHVPAGRYAEAALGAAGVWAALAPRSVRGDHVRTVLAWVARGEAAAGVVYATDARVEPRVAVAFTLPSDSHPPIVYPGAVAAGAAQAGEAARLLDHLRGPGWAAFEAAGFTPPASP